MSVASSHTVRSVLTTIRYEGSKVYQTKDAQNRVLLKYVCPVSWHAGQPCVKTQYVYDAADATDPEPDKVHESLEQWNLPLITLYEDIYTQIRNHFSDYGTGTEEHAALQALPFAKDVKNLTELIYGICRIMDAYILHEADAIAAAPVYHQAQTSDDDSLTSEVYPTNTAECTTRMNDIKAKLNLHMDDATAHTSGDTTQVSAADATNWEI